VPRFLNGAVDGFDPVLADLYESFLFTFAVLWLGFEVDTGTPWNETWPSVRLSPHRLRHTFATLSLKFGATKEQMQKEMGHINPKTTEGYLHVPDANIAAAHRRFSPITNQLRPNVDRASANADAKTPSVQSLAEGERLTRLSYSKKAHEHVRQLAEGLQSGIKLPWIKDSFIRGK
jgi:hypothetical protein